MGLSRRTALRTLLAGLALLAAAATVDLLQVRRAHTLNALIAAGTPPQDDGAQGVPEVRFAQAHAIAARGDADEAVRRYGLLQDDARLGAAARYNGAGLLLRQAQALTDAQRKGQSLALVELAKEGYRDLLRRNSDDWPARYNLERAQRMVPDPEEADDDALAPRKGAERAATTMRGYSPGLP